MTRSTSDVRRAGLKGAFFTLDSLPDQGLNFGQGQPAPQGEFPLRRRKSFTANTSHNRLCLSKPFSLTEFGDAIEQALPKN
jgi:hypothetical protein